MPDPYLVECKATPLHEYQRSLRILIRFNPAHLIPTVYNAFHLTNLFVCFFFLVTIFPTIALLHFHAKKTDKTQNSSICYEEGLTLETLALETLYGGQFTSSTKLIIPICHFIPLAQAAPQFLMVLWNVPPPPLYSNNSTCVEVIIGTVFKSCDKRSLSLFGSLWSLRVNLVKCL